MGRRSQITWAVGIVLVVSVAITIPLLYLYSTDSVRASIASELRSPSLLAGAHTVDGDPVAFMMGESAAKLSLPKSAVLALLESKQVFSDCHDAGRVCYTPVWSENNGFYNGNSGIETPPHALCAESLSTPERDEIGVHTICIDKSTDTLYYLSWSLGGR